MTRTSMILADVAFESLWPVLLAVVNGFLNVEPRLEEVARTPQMSRLATIGRIFCDRRARTSLRGCALGSLGAVLLARIEARLPRWLSSDFHQCITREFIVLRDAFGVV